VTRAGRSDAFAAALAEHDDHVEVRDLSVYDRATGAA
jgi:hypothetical protein